jgi:2-phosphosulfolactate phosphatase
MPLEQSRYQVRFDWGLDGAAAIGADADVLVWVDELGPDRTQVPVAAIPAEIGHVIAADVSSARAAAQWVVALQQRLGRPAAIAVIAAGTTRQGGRFRFAVEDQLAAGCLIAELGELGLDATSPEAAVAEAAYRGLARAVSHLLTASVTAQSAGETAPSGAARIDPVLSARDIAVLRPRE